MPTGVYPHRTIPTEERFWPKVRKTSTHWFWTGAINSAGYGHLPARGPQHPSASLRL